MKLDLSDTIYLLNGTKSDKTYGQVLATFLAYQTKIIDSVKAYDFSKILYKDGVLEIDASDLQKLKQEIESQQTLPSGTPLLLNYTSGEILKRIARLLSQK